MGDHRPALDVFLPPGPSTLTPLIDALLDDHNPFAIEEIDDVTRRVHFVEANDRDKALAAIATRFGPSGVSTTPVSVRDDHWAERSQHALRAIRVGHIVVAPPWDIPDEKGHDMVVIIRPSMGFGTGHHASTRLCLRALQTIGCSGQTVLDVGTGSGVLAISAAKCGAGAVTGLDHDRDAADTARDNVALNGLSDRVDIRHDDFRHAHDVLPSPLVLANLSAGVVCGNRNALLGLVTRGGSLVVGGVTTDEEAIVTQDLKSVAAVDHRYEEDGWVALVFVLPH